ncbi:MAG: hypothetical protein A3A88_02635 [Nitrospirae bacterium RIFCSPLOWO2_01_FULL_62_17]|nr:MAG: hypothetical protein A3A88_02635 [Nitrospirae bacterium RIFCSPLOWO2_01_FULL_62_17]
MDTIRLCAQSLGIKMHPQSRLLRFEQQLIRLGSMKIGEIKNTDFDFVTFTEGNRDVFEIAFICRTLSRLFPDEIGKVLKPLLDGAPLPSDDARTFARDMQFESYFAALFAHSGFEVILKEPDLIFEHEGTWYGVAAKRLSSADQLEKRVREAISQLEKARLRGLVALSADRLLPGETPRVVALSEKALDDAGSELMLKVLKTHGPTIFPLMTHPSVVGLIVNLVVPARMANTPGDIGATTVLRILPRPDDQGTNELTISINNRLKGPHAIV